MTSVDLLYGLCGDKIHRVDALTASLEARAGTTNKGGSGNER